MITCTRECTTAADVTLNGEPLCADHLHEQYPDKVESGHASDIPGLMFL